MKKNKKVPESGTKKKGENNMKFPRKAKLTKDEYIDLINKLINLGDYRVNLVVSEFLSSKQNELLDENEILLKKSIEKIDEIASFSDKESNIEYIERKNRLKNEYIKIDKKMTDNYKKIDTFNLEY